MLAMDAKTAELMGSKRILVVDDEHYTRKVIRALLLSIGVKKIQEACDGHAGLDAICTAVPDIVLVEWERPGLRAHRALAAQLSLSGRAPCDGHWPRRAFARDRGRASGHQRISAQADI